MTAITAVIFAISIAPLVVFIDGRDHGMRPFNGRFPHTERQGSMWKRRESGMNEFANNR
jgi:hypothetical protein